MLLIGCKPKSKSALDIKTDSTSNTSNKGLKMPDIGDLKKNNGWSKAFLSKNLSDCITRASNRMSASQAYTYCDCMMSKIEQKYPDEHDADTKFTQEELVPIDAACLPADLNQNNTNNNQTKNNSDNNTQNNSNYNKAWSTSDQQEFMDNCTPGASKSLGTTAATDYCSCMLQKLMQEYPNSADAGNVSKTHMSALASDCLRK